MLILCGKKFAFSFYFFFTSNKKAFIMNKRLFISLPITFRWYGWVRKYCIICKFWLIFPLIFIKKREDKYYNFQVHSLTHNQHNLLIERITQQSFILISLSFFFFKIVDLPATPYFGIFLRDEKVWKFINYFDFFINFLSLITSKYTLTEDDDRENFFKKQQNIEN